VTVNPCTEAIADTLATIATIAMPFAPHIDFDIETDKNMPEVYKEAAVKLAHTLGTAACALALDHIDDYLRKRVWSALDSVVRTIPNTEARIVCDDMNNPCTLRDCRAYRVDIYLRRNPYNPTHFKLGVGPKGWIKKYRDTMLDMGGCDE